MNFHFDISSCREQRCQRLVYKRQSAVFRTCNQHVGDKRENRSPVSDRDYRWCWIPIRLVPSEAGLHFACTSRHRKADCMISHQDLDQQFRLPIQKIMEAIENVASDFTVFEKLELCQALNVLSFRIENKVGARLREVTRNQKHKRN